ncbi:PRC-barrel domain protein [Stieleria maiorica]|uniref:PRC-barrel domain protein n=1 Tax=Stieleria maiorica TaxID=2795974 RepID=A0A5B9M7P4_9BACT|nr:PRC-barrel domain-containing protein [Stieleria maiorica]QEF96166.1 PRC-barrel domain protein [Stieleria maiorica]
MLIAFDSIRGTKLAGIDDDVGTIQDLLIDTDDWLSRHIVVDTGKWLPDRRVLLPPSILGRCDWQQRAIAIDLSQQQVKESPHVDSQKPVSRQMEMELFKHYDVPAYWGPAGVSLTTGTAMSMPLSAHVPAAEQQTIEEDLPPLRSAKEILNYSIEATDGDLGHVEDLIVDDATWAIRYVVVDTKNWLPSRKVLIAPEWVDAVSWTETKVHVDLTRDQIKNSPEYDPLTPINRGYEEHLYDYYGKERYWLP